MYIFRFSSSEQYASECTLPNRQTGQCMPVKSCRPIYETFLRAKAENRKLSADEVANLQKFFCGTISNTVSIQLWEMSVVVWIRGIIAKQLWEMSNQEIFGYVRNIDWSNLFSIQILIPSIIHILECILYSVWNSSK